MVTRYGPPPSPPDLLAQARAARAAERAVARRRRRRRRVLAVAAAVTLAGTGTTAVLTATDGDEALSHEIHPAGDVSSPTTTPQAAAQPAGTPRAASTPTPAGLPVVPSAAPVACTVSAKLVPSCGAWWGVAPVGGGPQATALRTWERKIGRKADIYHAYHRGKQIFPTPTEIALARERGRKRILLLNWKPLAGTWRQVAAGSADGHIDKLSAHIKRNFNQRFLLTIHHEPEDEVNQAAGSGMTAADYRAMFRHVIKRFRANGVTNIVTVVTFMGWPGTSTKSWFPQLYPGNDVVDWIAQDPYAVKGGDDTFAQMANRTAKWAAHWPGFYRWAAKFGKPMMFSEWGVGDHTGPTGRKARIFREMARDLGRFPQIKAFVYFDTPTAPHFGNTAVDSSPQALQAFRTLSRSPRLNPPCTIPECR